ncbi:MAG: protein kinase domain-containing protein, partial [Dokdonella sp.]|uniref:serine/threonine-protein kinase n=1 Tax=Dokdonella sp. TaxID=2291710 RepID=UPI003F7DA4A1
MHRDWPQVKALFDACLDAAPAARARLLGDETTVPPTVRAEVEALLAAHAQSTSLDRGAAAWGAPLFAGAIDDAGDRPERIGPYRVLRELGRGGMGVVWLACRDEPGFEQRVALKRVRGGLDGSEARARFRRERGILARLAHDRIARLLDGGVDADGRPWFALEYVEGEPIDRWCDARRLPLRARVRLFLDVLDGVAWAHRNLVVHRDLKPANVLVDGDGRVKLLDFGIAKLLDDGDADTTATGMLLMTPTYAAPEQVRGETVSTATDVYALGVLLFELATGLSPYRTPASTRPAFAHAVLEQEAERPARALQRTGVDAAALAAARGTTPAGLRAALDADFAQILSIALAKVPEQRHASVDAFAADLRAWLDRRPLLSRPTPRWRRLVQFARRHRVGLAAGALLGATAFAGIGATLWQARIAVRNAQTARAVREFTTGLFAAIDPDQARGREVPLREVLDLGARRAETTLADQPVVRGALLSDLGAIYTSLGDDARGIALLEQARDALLAQPRGEDEELARAWLRLAEAQFQDNRYEAAAGSTDAALRLLAPRAPADPLRIEGELRRVRIDEEADRLDAAGDRAERVIAALRADARAAPASLSDALAALGNLRRLQARHEDALVALEEALALARRDPDDPLVASRLHELAAAEAAAGQPSRAIAHLREAYALHRRVHGERHPLTLSTEGELAFALANSAQYAESDALFERNIAARRAVFGAQHPQVATSLNNVGVSLYVRRRHAEAAQSFGEAWRIWRATIGSEHASTRAALTGYGAALAEAGDVATAEPLVRQAYAMSQRLDPPRKQESSANTLALLLERTRRLDEAERVLRDNVELQSRANDGDVRRYAWTTTLLGRVLRERGDLAAAREQLERCFTAYDSDDYPDNPRAATCFVQLALVREAQHAATGDERALLERALAVQEAQLGKDDADAIATR